MLGLIVQAALTAYQAGRQSQRLLAGEEHIKELKAASAESVKATLRLDKAETEIKELKAQIGLVHSVDRALAILDTTLAGIRDELARTRDDVTRRMDDFEHDLRELFSKNRRSVDPN
ncbi:MAG TPA: hypothetical protein VJP88_09625 [Caulobacteraceae bacterium]|nr:hypothetical protein [Caulobacteraceae bacterium]